MTTSPPRSRLDYLDATRAFVLLLGIVFHASLSFMSVFIGWAVQDVSTSPLVGIFFSVSHTFRMGTFFLLAGFLGHVTYHRNGAASFVRSRLLRIGVPFVVGWFLLRPLLVSGWIMGSASLRGDYSVWAGLRGGFESLRTLPAGLFTGSHLWFLYYLMVITALTLVLRLAVKASGLWAAPLARRADTLMIWLAHSPLTLPVLVMPTAVALGFMQYWGMDTPDQSLRPHLPVLTIYSAFFGFGWLLARQQAMLAPLTRLTLSRWIQAAVGIAVIQYLARFQSDSGHPYYQLLHATYVIGYALTMWSLTLLTIGLFRHFCAQPNAIVRYLADSSYWLYLVHLPIVIWLQVAMAELPWHWSLKLGTISTLTILFGLLSYDLFVRPTWLGAFLNGRRRERALSRLFARSEPAISLHGR
ncbi:Glucans biosynthesis protein C [Lacunisphaera limnophila]|uniref:Glucans biosynthesis protein C n=1 Tax=Lacunisphaera limnophila TaxID=1838286 RepID=A0A1I7PI03_9BACT|nr:acyltransferase family protein [Lacunisphaera limnophila]AOS43255.1 Glucans biosynthesis protein C [Lacunisphaera limnophila]